MKFRDVIFWIHLCLGVTVGIVILVLATTGAMLAFEPQIVDFAERRSSNVTPPSQEAPKLTLDEIIAKVASLNPDKKITNIALRSDPDSSVVVGLGKEGRIFINPYTGEVLGKGSKVHDFMHKVEDVHRWFALEGKLKPIGHNIKSVCTIGFFLIIVSGFYLWWPRQWSWPGIKNVIMFNTRAVGKVRDWNWHNVIGFWSAPFLIIISLTGIIISYTWATNLLYRMTGNEPPVKVENKSPAVKNDSDRKWQAHQNVNLYLVRAQEKVSDWTSMNIRLPQKLDAPVSVLIENSSMWKPNRRNQLTLNSATGEVTKWEPYNEQNMGRKLRLWARYLHTGEAVGFWGQLAAGLASVGAVFLVWTGLSLSWQRYSSWRIRKIKIKN